MIELYINKQKVDLNEDINISLNYTSTDVDNPQAIKNSFSKNVKIPGTPNNNKVFNNIFRNEYEVVNSVNDNYFDPKKKIDFLLLDNGAFVEQGYLNLTSIDYTYPSVMNYNVTLYGGLGSFFYGLDIDEDGNKKTLYDLYYHWKSSMDASTGTNLSQYDEANDTIFNMTPKNIAFWWAKLDNAKYQTNLNDPTNAFSATISPVGNDLIAIPCYNGLPENFDAEHICVYDYNRRYEGSENTPQMPYAIKQQWNSTFPSSFTVDNVIYTLLDSEYSDEGYQRAGIAKAARPLDQWEARNLPINNFNVGLRLRRFLTAICDPQNNGGYNVYIDDDITYSNEFFDSFILLDKPLINEELAAARYALTWTGDTGINWVMNRKVDGSDWQTSGNSVSTNPTNEQFLVLGDVVNTATLKNKTATINLNIELACEIGNGLMNTDNVIFKSGAGAYTNSVVIGPQGTPQVVQTLSAYGFFGTVIMIKAYDENNNSSSIYGFVVTYNEDFRTVLGSDAKADMGSLFPDQVIDQIHYINATSRFVSADDSHTASQGYTNGTKLVKNAANVRLSLNVDPDYNNSLPSSISSFSIEVEQFWQHQTANETTTKILSTTEYTVDNTGTGKNWGLACANNNGYTIPQCLYVSGGVTSRRQEASISVKLNDSLYSGINFTGNQLINTKLTKKDILGGTDSPFKYLTDFTKMFNLKYLYDANTKTIRIIRAKDYYLTTTNQQGDKFPLIVEPVVDKSFTEKREPVFWNKRLYHYGLKTEDNLYSNYLYKKTSNTPWDTYVKDTKLLWNNEINDVMKDNIYVNTMPWQLSSIYFTPNNNMLPPIYAQPVIGWKLAKYGNGELKQAEQNFYTDANQGSIKYYDPMPKEMLMDKDNKYVVTKNSILMLNGYVTNYNWIKNSDSKWSLEGLVSISSPTPEMMIFNEGKQCYVYNNTWRYNPNGYCLQSDDYTVTPLYIPIFSKYSFNLFNGSQSYDLGYWADAGSGFESALFKKNDFPYNTFEWENTKFATKPYAGLIVSNWRNTEDTNFYTVSNSDTMLNDNATIYDRYFKPYVDDMFSNSARRITVKMRIDETPQTLMRKFIKYDGCLWIIEKIENYNVNSYFKDGHFCKTTLLKVNNPYDYIGVNINENGERNNAAERE